MTGTGARTSSGTAAPWWQQPGWRALLLIGAVVSALVSGGLAAEGSVQAAGLDGESAPPAAEAPKPEALPAAMVNPLSGGMTRPLAPPGEQPHDRDDLHRVSNGESGTIAGPSRTYHVRVGPATGSDRGIVLDRGHVDAFEVTYDQAETGLLLQVKDDTRIHDPGIVFRDPEDVTIAYEDERIIATLPTADGEWSFLGAYGGTEAWIAEQSGGDQGYAPWVGWSSERLHASLEGTGIEPVAGDALELAISIDGPGDVFTFMTDSFGGVINRHVDTSASGSHTIPLTANAHVHTNWVFTATGDYTLTVTPTLEATGIPAGAPGEGNDGDGSGDGADDGDAAGAGAGNGAGGASEDLADTGAINAGSLAAGSVAVALVGLALASQPRRRSRGRMTAAGA